MGDLEQYDNICHWLCAFTATIGIDYFKNKMLNWRFVSCLSVIVLGSLNMLYTLYIFRQDFTLLLKCIAASMQAITGITKVFTTVQTRRRQKGLLIFIRGLYIVNNEGSVRRKNIMQTATAKYFTTIKGAMAVCVLSLVIVATYPVYSFFYLDKVELFFEVQFIGHPMRKASSRTYIINYIVQFIELFYGYIGNLFHDAVLCTVVFYVYALIELQRAAFDEIEELIGIDRSAFERSLINCIVMIQDINNYILEINNIYSLVTFVQIGASAISMALSLFCSVTTDWLGAYGFALFSFIQILVYCLIGTFLERMSDELVEIIYQFPWYLTSNKNRKLLCFALMKTQKTTMLKIGGVADLNVNTAAIIFKTIYSYLMMLLNFTEYT